MYKPIPLNKSQKCGVGYWEGFSPKLRRDVTLLGDLEYDHWILVETNPLITTYCERPLEIVFSQNGKLIKSVPSLWVKYKDNSEVLIKVRYSRANPIKNRSIEQELSIEKDWCQVRNITHSIVTEHDIRSNSLLLSNKRLIISLVSNRLCSIDTDLHIITHYLIKQRLPLKRLFENCSIPYSRIIEGICWLIYKGELKSNLDQVPIGPELEVWQNE